MKKLLITTNLIIALFLNGFGVFEKHPKQESKEANMNIGQQKPSYSYTENPSYIELTDLYTTYSGQKNIVMLGNSLTNRISWNELMGRDDIANRGIGSDITEGFINRINFVLNVKPKICFIEGGVNDIAKNINNEIIVKNLNTLIDTLQNQNVKPVVITVTLVAETYKDASNFNSKIKALNTQIIQLANRKKIEFIDLNPQLSDGVFLNKEHAIADGIHFTSKAYLIWKKEIVKILEREKI